MDKLGILYGYENTTASGVLGAGNLRNDAMMYSDNASIRMFKDDKGVKVESKIQIL